jgi:uncharacterized membrane protein
MTNLVIAAVAFIALHRLVSGSPARALFVRLNGERAFQRLFGLATIANLVWLGFAYATARAPDATIPLWPAKLPLHALQMLVEPAALVLIVLGVATPNPGIVGQEKVVKQANAVHGILRVTRHPFLWGVAMLALGHLVALPTPRNLALFGSWAIVALSGTLSIDRKKQRAIGADWAAFARETSNLPFAAILAGRQRFRLDEIGLSRLGIAVAIALAATLVHPVLI